MNGKQTGKLEGLAEKIFLDRYAFKSADAQRAAVGDTVLVTLKDDPAYPTKEVGELIALDGPEATVLLRGGKTVVVPVRDLTATVEQAPEEMWDRLAEAVSGAETTEELRNLWRGRFRDMLDDWKLVPGGRIMAGAGAGGELTLFNCYVIPSPHDSRGGIMRTLTEMTEIMARGGGVGINLSSLRPRRAVVAGVNGSSSGAVSWGGLFSYATGLIEQGGSRRGALMLMINDWHPDLLDFITVKQMMGEVTNANLSVCVSDAFMQAVRENRDWEMGFPDTRDPEYDELWDGDLAGWRRRGKRVLSYRTMPARDIWQLLIESAWKSAEPGVVFMERYNDMSNSWYFNPIISTNPCFHPDTRISTEFGLIRVEDLYRKAGGRQFGIVTDNRLIEQAKIVGGRAYEASGVTWRQASVFPTGVKPTLTVCLDNGMELQVTGNHRIYTSEGWKRADELKQGDPVYVQSGAGGFAQEDGLGEHWGLFLGWLTGDGRISRRGDAELGMLPAKAPDKRVPEAIFTSSEKTAASFLSALFSADGTVCDRDDMHRTVRLSSSSRRLLQDVQLLLLNFGIHGKIYPGMNRNQALFRYTNRSGEEQEYESKPQYELILSGNNICVFKEKIGFHPLSEKQRKLETVASPSRKRETFISKVKSVVPGGPVTVYDLSEPATNSLIASGMVVHNCGEQGLPGWGVCNLSAVNLSKFYDETRHDVDWEELAKVTRRAVRFLDNVIDATPYHFAENERNQKRERRIGLGTMGLAELLIKLRIRYGSAESLAFLDRLYGFIAREAYSASSEIAAEKGSFPAFDKDNYLRSGFMRELTGAFPEIGEAIAERGMRNVTVITQAPTGSTGTMAGTSTGIEPYFAFEYFRQSRLGLDKQYVPIAREWKEAHPDEELPDYFVAAMDLSAEEHIRVQAAIQRWVDSSISKTANCPADFTIEETMRLYELAYELGCKGVTIYRDGSRDAQVLSTGKDGDDGKAEASAGGEAKIDMEITVDTQEGRITGVTGIASQPKADPVVDKAYRRRPQTLRGATYKLNTPLGAAYITINDLNGSPGEIFLNVGKAGSDVFAMAEALGRVCSLFLRYGDHGSKAQLLIKHLKGIGGTGAIGFGAGRVESIADAVAKALEMHLEAAHASEAATVGDGMDEEEQPAVADAVRAGARPAGDAPSTERSEDERERGEEAATGKPPFFDLCPSCGAAALINSEGCLTCVNCGYSRCN